MNLYLDNCCFNRPFDDQTQLRIRLETEAKLYIQARILDGKYNLAWSYMLDFENAQNPFEQRKETVQNWREIAFIDINENDKVISLAEKIASKGLKPKDVLHIACAIVAGCEYFITTDSKILNKSVEGIILIDPIGFIKLERIFTMMTDTVLKSTGMKILIEKLGKVGAERFIALVIKEPFDYTKWQSEIFEGMSVKEVSEAAMEHRKNQDQ